MNRDPERPPSPAQIADASKVRKRLIDSFARYDVAARRIRDIPAKSPTQRRLQRGIYQQASNFLHLHMLPLKSLPKVLKHAAIPEGQTPDRIQSPRPPTPSTLGHRTLESAKPKSSNTVADSTSTAAASDNSSAISAMEEEEKNLRERLVVLEEQKFFVSNMIADANRHRKFDEVSSLAMNSEDLSREIDNVNGMLGKLDFEDVYTRAR